MFKAILCIFTAIIFLLFIDCIINAVRHFSDFIDIFRDLSAFGFFSCIDVAIWMLFILLFLLSFIYLINKIF